MISAFSSWRIGSAGCSNDLSRGAAVFERWMKAHRPDGLISFDRHIPDWLEKLRLRIPESIGLVVHDWTTGMESYAGVYQRRDQIASAAVDIVATQLQQHESGVPAVARQILIPPLWVDGPSLRALPAERLPQRLGKRARVEKSSPRS